MFSFGIPGMTNDSTLALLAAVPIGRRPGTVERAVFLIAEKIEVRGLGDFYGGNGSGRRGGLASCARAVKRSIEEGFAERMGSSGTLIVGARGRNLGLIRFPFETWMHRRMSRS